MSHQLEIRILWFHRACYGLFDNGKNHIAAVIIDKQSGQHFDIDYFEDPVERRPRGIPLKDKEPNNGLSIISLEYNGDKSLDDFKKEYNRDDNFHHENHDLCINNCADAVNFALEYFFPQSIYDCIKQTFLRMVCCPCFCVSCGGSCFPGICKTPSDVFSRAKKITSPSATANDGYIHLDEKKPVVSPAMTRESASVPTSKP